MAQMPKPHGQPGPASTRSDIGPPAQVVKIKGEVANDNMSDRFFRDVVSEMKTVKQ